MSALYTVYCGDIMDISIVYTTVGPISRDDKLGLISPAIVAKDMGEILVRERLAFCVNIIPHVDSVFWYGGKLELSDESGEAILQIKTYRDKVETVMQRISQLHSYDVPMIWSINVDMVGELAQKWIADCASR